MLTDLEKRLRSEEEFHDARFSASNGRKSYYDLGFKSFVNKKMMEKVGDIKEKKIVEFGCGDGWFTKKLLEQGAEVWAFDLSIAAIKKTYRLLSRLKLDKKVHLDQMAAEKMIYDSEMFDLVVGNAILHHVDLSECLPEIKRILKNGGKAFFTEPLGHNPILNIYRMLTPQLRSKDEKPLTYKQFEMILEYFPKFKHYDYYLTAVLAVFFHFINLNKHMLTTRDLLFRLDKKILTNFQFLKRYCWYSILEIEK